MTPRNLSILTVVTLSIVLMGALTSQVNTYTNGSVLTASQLNSEFGNIYSTINNLDQANLSDSTSIPPTKISASIDGDGISRNGGTGALSVSVDASTIETSSDQIRVKDAGVTAAKLATNSVTTAKITDLSVTSDKIAADAIVGSKIAPGAVVTSDLADNAVDKNKLEVKLTGTTVGVGGVGLTAGNGFQSGLTGTGNFANLTVTITTRGGPVALALIPVDGVSSLSYLSTVGGRTDYQFKRGSTVLCNHAITDTDQIPVGGITCLDVPAAGTYTYTASYSVFSGTGVLRNARMMVYEL